MAGGFDKMDGVLTTMASKLGKGETVVRVGFLEGSTYPDGTSVPLVAVVNNFGSPSRGVPPRPFFSGMVAAKSPEWPNQLMRVLQAADYDASLALARMGEGIAGQLRQSIVDLVDPPLSPVTVARKGGTPTAAKPLVDTGHMLNSIGSQVVEGGE